MYNKFFGHFGDATILDLLLTEMCYCSRLYGTYLNLENYEIFFLALALSSWYSVTIFARKLLCNFPYNEFVRHK